MVVFQPHLFSRTKDFMDDFARELSKFSQIVLIDIYPARERPLKGISSKELLDRTINENKTLLKKIDLKDYISKSDAEVIVVMGAGDISVEVEKIKNAILN
jgi:UDP-N-acetylmuramate--alanine ligase